MKVKLFSKPGCGQCIATERAFKSKGVDYEYVDLSTDEEAVATIKSLGYLGAPVVYLDEDTHWTGFQLDKIEEHLLN